MTTAYPPQTRVLVYITRAIPPGLLGLVDGSTRAIVRKREIAWQEPAPLQNYIGRTLPAVVIGYNRNYDELELSLRLVERDPWREVGRKYPCGREVRGRVVGLIEGGAFVELEPGVEGFLPRNEIGSPNDQPLEKWLWVEDRVRAVVLENDPTARRLRLSVRALLRRREEAYQRRIWGGEAQQGDARATIAEMLPGSMRRDLWNMVAIEEPPPPPSTLDVLLIEDDDLCAAGLESLLQSNGCRVKRLASGYEAIGLACQAADDCDLVLIDWNLPGPKGHKIVRQLQEQGCRARLVMLAGLGPFTERPEVRDELQASGIDIFAKGDADSFEAGLLSILQELRAANGEPSESRQPFLLDFAPPSANQFPDMPGNGATIRPLGNLTDALERLLQDTTASTVALLSVDPAPPGIRLEACAGVPLPMERATPDLIHSPLADILQKRQNVWEQVSANTQRFTRLLEWIPFESLIGLPVPGGTASYGLILFKERGRFDKQHLQAAHLATYLVAGILQEGRLLRILQPWQQQYLAGQLTGSVIHEVNGKLLAIRELAPMLGRELSQLARHPEKADDPVWLARVTHAANCIAEAQRQAEEVRGRYLGLTVDDAPEAVMLQFLLEGIRDLLHPQAQRANVTLELHLPAELPPVYARPSELRQILMNLLLNALQQMEEMGRQGQLVVEVQNPPDPTAPLQLRVRDDGPGIHTSLQERIFEFGYTTRRGGAGLGLTIARQTARALGGDLCVEESEMLWGTTFLLELPKGA